MVHMPARQPDTVSMMTPISHPTLCCCCNLNPAKLGHMIHTLRSILHLQKPLVALDGLAHVTYRISRTRLMASKLAYAADDSNNDALRAALRKENDLLRKEYNTLM